MGGEARGVQWDEVEIVSREETMGRKLDVSVIRETQRSVSQPSVDGSCTWVPVLRNGRAGRVTYVEL